MGTLWVLLTSVLMPLIWTGDVTCQLMMVWPDWVFFDLSSHEFCVFWMLFDEGKQCLQELSWTPSTNLNEQLAPSFSWYPTLICIFHFLVVTSLISTSSIERSRSILIFWQSHFGGSCTNHLSWFLCRSTVLCDWHLRESDEKDVLVDRFWADKCYSSDILYHEHYSHWVNIFPLDGVDELYFSLTSSPSVVLSDLLSPAYRNARL